MRSPKEIVESIIGPVTIGSMLKAYRATHELTEEVMAHKMKVTVDELHKIESGKEQLPLKEVVHLAEKLEEPKHVYARVWCEEQVKKVGMEFDDIVKVI